MGRIKKRPEVVLGLVGLPCAGKGAAIEYLIENHHFHYSSLSDRIREELRRRGDSLTRDNLQGLGGELRQNHGPEVLAVRTWQKILKVKCLRGAIDAIRAKEEAEFLKKQPGFYLVAILAKAKGRFQRMQERNRESDPQTWEEFLIMEARDKKAEGRDIESCLQLADFNVENNGKLGEFYQKIDQLVKRIFS